MIAVILLNYNKAEFLKRCLDSLLQQTEQELRIIVVENGSTDESKEILNYYSTVEVVDLAENIGVCGGRNAGIKALGKVPEYVLFLDSDMELQPETITCLKNTLEKEEKFSLSGPLVFQGEGEKEVISAGGYFKPSLARLALRKGRYSEETYAEMKEVDFLPGCCFLIRGSALEATGLFHEGFDPYGMEDVEFTLRARGQGFLSVFVPDARARHLSDYSFFFDTSERVFTTTRNRLLLGKLHCPPSRKTAFFGAFFLRWFLLRALLLLLSGNLLGAFAVFRGTLAGLKNDKGKGEKA